MDETYGIGVDHDGVGVPVDDLQIHFLHQSFGLQQNLTASRSDQGRQRFGVEPRERKAQAAVHRVGRQFESLLSNVVLQP